MGLDDHWGQAHILISAVGKNGLSHGIPLGLAHTVSSGDGLVQALLVRSQLALIYPSLTDLGLAGGL